MRGCHLTMYIGSNCKMQVHACTEVPTTSTSPQASLDSLGGAVNYLTSRAVLGSSCGGSCDDQQATSALCPLVSAEPEAQQTPDSAVPCLGLTTSPSDRGQSSSGSRQTEAGGKDENQATGGGQQTETGGPAPRSSELEPLNATAASPPNTPGRSRPLRK